MEQSQSDGVIKVEAIYEAPNDVLHIFIDRRRAPGHATVGFLQGEGERISWVRVKRLYREQLSPRSFPWGGFPDGKHPRKDVSLQCIIGYIQVFLHIGGVQAVRAQPGWASWTQLWPGTSVWVRHDSGQGRAFDVSDVDTGNIPDPDCVDLLQFSRVGCEMWKRDPDSGIAGFASDSHRTRDKFLAYMQIKETLLPASEDEQEALKQRLYPGYDESRVWI